MKLLQTSKERVTIEFSKDDLGLIDNALNEVCNGIEVKEFDIKMGLPIKEARRILRDLATYYLKLK